MPVSLALMVASTMFSSGPPQDIPVRREASLRFSIDEAFQAHGGVQYAFSIEDEVPGFMAALDISGKAADSPHVLTSRLVHTLGKDVSFFSARRATDVGYMNAVAPGYDITALGDRRFHARRTPSNDFTVDFLDAAGVVARRDEPAMAQLLALCGSGLPDSVVVQHNTDFGRVMGVRTADRSFTYTAHFAHGEGRTRVCAVTLSHVVTLPPFFLGGPSRMHTESLKEALALIRNLREYPVE